MLFPSMAKGGEGKKEEEEEEEEEKKGEEEEEEGGNETEGKIENENWQNGIQEKWDIQKEKERGKERKPLQNPGETDIKGETTVIDLRDD